MIVDESKVHIVRQALLEAREFLESDGVSLDGLTHADDDGIVIGIASALEVLNNTFPKDSRDQDELVAACTKEVRNAKTQGAAERLMLTAVEQIAEKMIDRAHELLERAEKRGREMSAEISQLSEELAQVRKLNARMMHEKIEQESAKKDAK